MSKREHFLLIEWQWNINCMQILENRFLDQLYISVKG